MQYIEFMSAVIGMVGALVIIWGVIVSVYALLIAEIGRFRNINVLRKRDETRRRLGSYILLGLELLIAADVISTILKPDLQELATLGAIVAIRTVLSFFLNMEMKQEQQQEEESSG